MKGAVPVLVPALLPLCHSHITPKVGAVPILVPALMPLRQRKMMWHIGTAALWGVLPGFCGSCSSMLRLGPCLGGSSVSC